LIKERERHRKTKQAFQERWEAAAQRMKAVDEAIVKFDDHYRESNEERERSVSLAARQDELKDLKLADIRSLKKERQFLLEIKEETGSRVERFKHVQKYLEKVRDESNGQYKSIRDLLDRYNLLSSTRSVLMNRDTRARDLVRRRTKQLKDLKLIKANEAVSLNNHIFEMREEFEELKNSLMRMDEDFLHIKTTTAQRAKDLGQVRIATYNLYLQVCRKFHHPASIIPSDTIQQLQYIQNSMKEMNKLRKEVKHILKSAREAAEQEKKAEEQAALELSRKKHHRSRKLVADAHAIFGIARPPPHPHQPKMQMAEKAKETEKSVEAKASSAQSVARL
jgi:hypothetical protein